MKPSVARNVHYLNQDGVCVAAIVTGVQADENTVGLYVMPDDGFPYRAADVHAGEPGDRGAWHWPERVD